MNSRTNWVISSFTNIIESSFSFIFTGNFVCLCVVSLIKLLKHEFELPIVGTIAAKCFHVNLTGFLFSLRWVAKGGRGGVSAASDELFQNNK